MSLWEGFKSYGKRLWGVDEKIPMPVEEAAARDPKKIAVKKIGQALKAGGGSEFEESVVDLEEIQRAYNTDSYIRRAVDKYAELMFKEGWEISGKNDAATEYVWTRLKLMAEASQTPIDELWKDIAFDLVLYGNAFVAKGRQKSGGGTTGVTAVGYTGKQPISHYEVLPPATIQIARDPQGKILNYVQDTGGGGDTVTIKAEDMVHFYYKKPRGRAFGIPFVFTVLDDVKMLRQIEENVARLIYRNLFPLYQYQVGIDKPGFEASEEEIENIREEIRSMPMDGGIVVPERHNISVVGSQGSALDASEYLKYFRQRVFTGLGVSDSIMGIGDTANRATSDNQSADLFDSVKEFQACFSITAQAKLINELLFEGGFDPVINIDDEVNYEFFEIEMDAKIKKENHAVQMFTQNAISHEEMRASIGKDPVTDEGRLYFNMITGALAQQAADNAMAQAQASASQQAANNAGSNKDQPANQSGKANSPGKSRRSGRESAELEEKTEENAENVVNVLTETHVMVTFPLESDISSYLGALKKSWHNLRDDVNSMIRSGKSEDYIRSMATELVRQSMRLNSDRYISSALMAGTAEAKTVYSLGYQNTISYGLAIRKVSDKSKGYVDRLVNDMVHLISVALKEDSTEATLSKIMGAFAANEYRLQFIANTELYRAYNYGQALAMKEAGYESIESQGEAGCSKCQERHGEVISLADIDLLEKIPPHHGNCTCPIKLILPAEEV